MPAGSSGPGRGLEGNRLGGQGQAGDPGRGPDQGGGDENDQMTDRARHDQPSVAGRAIAPPSGRSRGSADRFDPAREIREAAGPELSLNLSSTGCD
ncbi:hypothetical protein STVA_37570 [Allostella vacuolata]|nr:hypothetical protein STVA_37570 [Stella vacuolata]